MGQLTPCEALRCTVRGCGEPLERVDRAGFVCSSGHRFDRSRHGYVNLLQPQERRSRTPGDSDASVLARRRLFERGILAPIYGRLRERIADAQSVLDVGCGEGHFAGPLAAYSIVIGIDLSTKAIELAARRWEDACWVVANVDRQIPVATGSMDVITSIAARRNRSEFARVLARGGRVMVAVPAEDDLIELRERIGGEAVRESRVPSVIAEFGTRWRVVAVDRVAESVECDDATVRDLLAVSYRGQRRSAASVVQEIGTMMVTLSFDVVDLVPSEQIDAAEDRTA